MAMMWFRCPICGTQMQGDPRNPPICPNSANHPPMSGQLPQPPQMMSGQIPQQPSGELPTLPSVSGGLSPSQPSGPIQQPMMSGPIPPPQPGYPPQQPFYPMQNKPSLVQRYTRLGKGAQIGLAALAFIVVCACVGIVAANSGGSPSASSTPTAPAAVAAKPTATFTPAGTPTDTPTPKPTATPTPSYPHFGDGTYQVGKDIQPGTYRTRVGSPGCYYERLKGFSGSLDDIIANNLTDAPAIVTIAATDKGFTSKDCGTWTQNLSQITQSKTTFEDGMYIVGTDITPGTYKNSGGEGCYWARLKGFGNTVRDIIANDLVDNPTIVTIKSSDKGFESNDCGTWTKQ
jgi:hypothetical protein